jgi:inorganic pyrophosphatase/exopolyphosphatase
VKSDLSTLTVSQLLRKDLKVVSVGTDLTIAMSSVMMSVNQMSLKENFVEELKSFLEIKNCTFSFIMGAVVFAETGNLERNILIFPVSNEVAGFLADQLLQREELKLAKVEASSENTYVIFKQGDAAFSRKKILPIIKDVLRQKP